MIFFHVFIFVYPLRVLAPILIAWVNYSEVFPKPNIFYFHVLKIIFGGGEEREKGQFKKKGWRKFPKPRK